MHSTLRPASEADKKCGEARGVSNHCPCLISTTHLLTETGQSHLFRTMAPLLTRLAAPHHHREAPQQQHLTLLGPSSRGRHHAFLTLWTGKAGGSCYGNLLDRCQTEYSTVIYAVYKVSCLMLPERHQQPSSEDSFARRFSKYSLFFLLFIVPGESIGRSTFAIYPHLDPLIHFDDYKVDEPVSHIHYEEHYHCPCPC